MTLIKTLLLLSTLMLYLHVPNISGVTDVMEESCQQRSCQTSRASEAKLLILRRGSSGCHDRRKTSALNMYKPRALHTHILTHTHTRKENQVKRWSHLNGTICHNMLLTKKLFYTHKACRFTYVL